MTDRKMHLDMPTIPDLSSSTGTPTPGTSTVVTPSIVLPPELRPLASKTARTDSGTTSPASLDPVHDLDLSLPLSTLLRESTKIAHTQAEHSPGAIALAGGTLPFREYVRYLAALWIVYSVLEREIARHASRVETEDESEVLALLWNEQRGGKGRMLSRADSLAQDIEYLLSIKPSSEWTTDPRDANQSTISHALPSPPFPIPPFLSPLFTSPPSAITAFTSRLTDLSAARPALLLAHAYVRYLGDLSGGQLVRSRIRRVYALDPPSTSSEPSAESVTEQAGTQFYEFDIFDSADRAVEGGVSQPTMYERKQRMTDIKEWFRGVLDSGTADGKEELKRALVDEAIECFHLSTHIFSALRPTPAGPSDNAASSPEDPPAVRQMPPKSSDTITWRSFRPLMIVFALYIAWIAYKAAK
ncbi:hypothetical protein NliqN6_0168 [Naganishia liquefaciens]|uniref:Heme oxygenase n=1 Tax=Naganishia liquefaciens TaxID=104408 RepID=A0A8H3TN48_9TREE|nr:hypothetical protein NliqN6_0168 [Naganishia liquefaciens]